MWPWLRQLVVSGRPVQQPCTSSRGPKTDEVPLDPSKTGQDFPANTAVQYRDVFLSHAGEEKFGIVSVIKRALERDNKTKFLDIDDLVAGQSSKQTLEPALLAARAVVVVVSLSFLQKDYPMQELNWLLNDPQFSTKAVPVFYKLTRSECRKGALSAAAREALKSNPRAKEVGYQQLVADLDKLAWCGNKDFSNPETSDADIADWVVGQVALKLGSAAAYLPPKVSGIEEEVEHLAGLMKQGGVLGLYGPGGIGKTTLARALYNKLLDEQPCFTRQRNSAHVKLAESVDGKHVTNRSELACLNDIMQKLGCLPLATLPAADALTGLASGRPLLLLFDNVWDSGLLTRLLAHLKGRSASSVIIVTSRGTQYLLPHCSRSNWLQRGVAPIADPKVPEQILSAYAERCFDGLSATARQHLHSILEKSSGFPLALKAVGGYIKIQLDHTDESSWEKALNALSRADLREGDETGGQLKPIVNLTLEYLDHDKESKPCSNMFLDVAAVLAGEAEAAALYAWGALYPHGEADDCLRRLVNSSLISIAAGDATRPLQEGGSRLVVHDLILTIGRSMINDHQRATGDARRIWSQEQLKQARRARRALPQPVVLSGAEDLLDPEVSDSSWLQICMLGGDAVNTSAPGRWLAKHQTELLLLQAQKLAWSSLPSPPALSSLRVLRLVDCSCLTSFRGMESLQLKQLQRLEVVGCPHMTDVEGIVHLTDLQQLRLDNTPVAQLPEGIGNLQKLEVLQLSGCHFTCLPEGLSKLSSLWAVHINNCQQLHSLPYGIFELPRLQQFVEIECANLSQLPSSLTVSRQLQRLRLRSTATAIPFHFQEEAQLAVLDLGQCYELQQLPESISRLDSLKELILLDCWNLSGLRGADLNSFKVLIVLRLDGCSRALECLPDSISCLTSLQILSMKNCAKLARLPVQLGDLAALRLLDLSSCRWLKQLPESAGQLRKLQQLLLPSCNSLEQLPDSMEGMSSLTRLDMAACYSLTMDQQQQPQPQQQPQQLQQQQEEEQQQQQQQQQQGKVACAAASLRRSSNQLVALQQLNATGCRMAHLPPWLGSMTALKAMHLNGCRHLQQLPVTISCLASLQELELAGCVALHSLPQLPSQLTLLRLGGCAGLTDLAAVGSAQKLRQLDISGVQMPQLPDSISALTALQQLYAQRCTQLEQVPGGLSCLVALQLLDLEGCSALQALPDQMCALTLLQLLCLRGCSSLQALPASLSSLNRLTDLRLGGASQQLHVPPGVGSMPALHRDEDIAGVEVRGWAWQDQRSGNCPPRVQLSPAAAAELQEMRLYYYGHGLIDATYRVVFIGPQHLKSAPAEHTAHVQSRYWCGPHMWCELSLQAADSSSSSSKEMSGMLVLQCSEFGGAFVDKASALVGRCVGECFTTSW
uniref:TIR domain-containing protein n=1 Tax=Tetradesmus obliquus TaxID=3088 RepID=A0A383VCV7_TETOB|eukprot:jgi/Sobl393_1/19559/SZX63405.1